MGAGWQGHSHHVGVQAALRGIQHPGAPKFDAFSVDDLVFIVRLEKVVATMIIIFPFVV